MMDRHSHEQKPTALPAPRRRRSRDHIVLCIGGTILQTSKQTLCTDSDSMLAAWVLRHLHDEDADLHRSRNDEDHDAVMEEQKIRNEKDRILWIDRDAHRFGHVLNYLRNGTIWLEDVASLRAVQEEAVYFGLSGLQSLCEERIQILESLKKQHTDQMLKAMHGAILDYCKSQLSHPINRSEICAPQDPIFRMDEDF